MSDDRDFDDMARERVQAPKELPATYVDPVSGRQFTKGAPVLGVTEDEIRRYGYGGQTCGECRFFEPGHAQAEMARTRFLQVLARDYEWNPTHAGMAPERSKEIGLCAASGDTATTAFCPACDQFRENRGKLKKEAEDVHHEVVVKDMRAAQGVVRDRFESFKKKHGLDGPGEA